jgi:hypothetical protein
MHAFAQPHTLTIPKTVALDYSKDLYFSVVAKVKQRIANKEEKFLFLYRPVHLPSQSLRVALH